MQSHHLGQRFTTTGLPLNGGKAYFYITGTTTLQTVFADDALTTPLANPVVADSAGFFPELVYLTPTVEYRCIIKTSANATISDADPINTPSASGGIDGGGIDVDSIPGTAFAPGAVEAALGYTPADVSGEDFSGPVSVAGAFVVTTAKTTLAAGAAGYASLNIPDASADPSSPANGDIWHEANALKTRLNSLTQTLATVQSIALSQDGYMQIGGVVFQWGRYAGGSSSPTITFPLAFPTACFVVVPVAVGGGSFATNSASTTVHSVALKGTPSTTQFEAWCSWEQETADVFVSSTDTPFHWIAIGH